MRKTLFLFLICMAAGSSLPAYDLNQAEIKINIAREDVELSKSSIKDIENKLTKLRLAEPQDQEKIAKYENYLSRLEKLLEAQEKSLHEMEEVYKKFLEAEIATKPKTEQEDVVDWKISEEPEVEEGSVEALERELAKSLGEFDDFILKEQASLEEQLEEIETRHANEIEELKKAAEEAKRRSSGEGETTPTDGEHGENNSDSESVSGEEADAKDKESNKDAEGESGDRDAEQPETEGAAGEGTESDSEGGNAQRDAATDDVVARQLREAAEAEKDPVLKEKLWKEYDNYKSSI